MLSILNFSNLNFKKNNSKILRLASQFLLLGVTTLTLVGCGTQRPPANTNNICSIFREYPKWYWEAHASYHRWGVPIPVSMAIIREESYFVNDAKPPRTTVLGVIPWTRPTSAYGFSQATDGAWQDYQQSTKNQDANRDQFGAAVDFVGWYGNLAHEKLGISKSNAYDLYLAYHEGIAGYQNHSYANKTWLIEKSQAVQKLAQSYQQQLKYCRADIPQANAWNLWLM